LPASVIDRPKSGMRVPVHFWLKGEMKRYARKILSRRELRRAGIFRPERVKQLLRYDIEEGRGRYGLKLWMLLTFEIWRRIVIEGEPL
jgi:asparagine synthase (glutamine-hydrolysing)